jgi:hypothetical protein
MTPGAAALGKLVRCSIQLLSASDGQRDHERHRGCE